ncbi:zinc finger domain-containing protein [Gordonia hongkongensis]|uniref:zinc finger domain-containing protein n=1 Tax=Gordonia hongkongensis TaxID=1701090 RepID=UPI003D73AD54
MSTDPSTTERVCKCAGCKIDRPLRKQHLTDNDQGAYFTALSELVDCPRCKSPAGTPCVIKRPRRFEETHAYHLGRGDRAIRYIDNLKLTSGHRSPAELADMRR